MFTGGKKQKAKMPKCRTPDASASIVSNRRVLLPKIIETFYSKYFFILSSMFKY